MAMRGLFGLLPILLLYLLLAEALDLIVALATPIADLFPEETFRSVQEATQQAEETRMMAERALFLAASMLLLTSIFLKCG